MSAVGRIGHTKARVKDRVVDEVADYRGNEGGLRRRSAGGAVEERGNEGGLRRSSAGGEDERGATSAA